METLSKYFSAKHWRGRGGLKDETEYKSKRDDNGLQKRPIKMISNWKSTFRKQIREANERND